jgi:hypothetical protein
MVLALMCDQEGVSHSEHVETRYMHQKIHELVPCKSRGSSIFIFKSPAISNWLANVANRSSRSEKSLKNDPVAAIYSAVKPVNQVCR